MVRFGILGTAHIARAFCGEPLRNASLTAIGSRDRSKARAFAEQYTIPLAFGSYEEVINSPHVDAVYIPLPQHLHAEYTIRAARAGKHVLVEKPGALTAAEAQDMDQACKENGVMLMEGFMYRFKQIHARVRDIINGGEIGDLRWIDFNWCFNIRALERSAFRLQRDAGGGVLYDLAIYGIDFLRFLFNEDPVLHHAVMKMSPGESVEMFSHSCWKVQDAFAAVTVGYLNDANAYTISGETGSLYVPGSLSGRKVENVIQVHLLRGDERREERFAPENPYTKELEYFSECIETSTEPVPGGQSMVRNLKLLEQVQRLQVSC